MYQLQLFDFGKQTVLKVFNQKPTSNELRLALGDFAEHTDVLLQKHEAVVTTGVWLKLVEVNHD